MILVLCHNFGFVCLGVGFIFAVLFSLSLVPWHRSTALGIAAISLKEGQLGRIVVASL